MKKIITIINNALFIKIPFLYFRFINKFGYNKTNYDLFRFLCRFKFKKIINKYRFLQQNISNNSTSKIIWSMWWDGENRAPCIVKKCLNSIRANCPVGTKIIIIDKYNYKKYIDFSKGVSKAVIENRISITHLSDIVRVYLLSKYGGAWIDATVYISRKIPSKLFDYYFYSLSAKNSFDTFYSKGKWTSFLQFSHKNCIIVSFCYEILDAYWNAFSILFDYFFIDIVYRYGYDYFKNFKLIVDSIDKSISPHENCYLLVNNLDNSFDDDLYQRIISSAIFFKLDKSKNYKLFTSNNKETIYNRFIKTKNV